MQNRAKVELTEKDKEKRKRKRRKTAVVPPAESGGKKRVGFA
jgi:hypothetical protein